jgi:hypothetical protein
MHHSTPAEIASRAEELLWVIARCDVENVRSHRDTALEQLRNLELRAAALNMPDLYEEVCRVRT